MNTPFLCLLAGDLLISYAALGLAYIILGGATSGFAAYMDKHAFDGFVFAMVLIFSSYMVGLYRRRKDNQRKLLFFNSLFSASFAFMFFSIITVVSGGWLFPRAEMFLSLGIFVVFQTCWHGRFSYVFVLANLQKRVLIFGVGNIAAGVSEVFSEDNHSEVLVGYLKPVAEEVAVEDAKVLGNADELTDVIEKHRIDCVVIAISERRGVLPVKEILNHKIKGVEIIDSVTFIENMTGKLMLESINPSWFIFSESSRLNRMVRLGIRVMDVISGTLGLLVSLPLFPLVALAIKIDSEGPIFFTQTRVGEGGENFTLIKFRTMRQDAEHGTGAVWAQESDPRVTKLGKFLRVSRIDELPQFINVIKGDMSFIGPRPERPEFVERLEKVLPYYTLRHFVKPGLTGWAQVNYPYGASVDDALAKLRYDLFYIKNYTVFLDLLIATETIKVVFFGRGGR